MKIILNGTMLLLGVARVYQWWTGSPPTAPVTQVNASGGSYGALAPAQRGLVDDLVARYETVTGKPAVPAEMYDGLALSTKTTFNAVTHALSRTPLTDSAEVSQGQKTEDCVKASLFKDLFPTAPLETLTTRATHA
jgi:hypothetical protein